MTSSWETVFIHDGMGLERNAVIREKIQERGSNPVFNTRSRERALSIDKDIHLRRETMLRGDEDQQKQNSGFVHGLN
ncbi:MAG: hypothetical protein HYW57_04470 [Ignavibacteriales bacterium]|nr:hypothetical protein [Ignavibacteriales bacterium]